MASLSEIREAIRQTLLDNISGINVYRNVPGAIIAPAVCIYPKPKDYLHTFGNASGIWEFDLIVAIEGDDDAAQDPLDELIDQIGERSIPLVLLSNPKLGRADCSIKGPVTLVDYGARIKFGDDTYPGATIHIGVVTTYR